MYVSWIKTDLEINNKQHCTLYTSSAAADLFCQLFTLYTIQLESSHPVDGFS